MDPSFIRALQKIAVQLRERPGARFSVIINGQKKPEGKDWAGVNGANYAINDPPLAGYLSQGHNYGVLCGHAGINVADIDDPARVEALGIMQRIPDTFKVKTGRGGQHAYFDCPELDHQIGLYDPELKDEDGEPLHLGEIQSKGQQVVGPGSTHPNGNKYELINDAPILKISKADLLKIFDGLILTGIDDHTEEPWRSSERRCKSGGSSIGDNIPIDQVAWPKDIKKRSGSEVIGTHPIHGSTTGNNFSVNTAKNCWHCFRCGPPGEHRGGGGPLEWLAVEAGLIACKDAKPGCLDDKTLFMKVLQIARDRGFYIPNREKAEEPKGPTLDDALLFIADRCDGATSIDGQGFGKFDVLFGKAMAAKVRSGKRLSSNEYKAVHKMLSKYNKQLVGGHMDIRLIPKEQPEIANDEQETREEIPEDIRNIAQRIAEHGKPLKYMLNTFTQTHKGDQLHAESQFIGFGMQSAYNTKGVFGTWDGPSGKGKSDGARACVRQLPPEYTIISSITAKSMYHRAKDGSMLPGTVLFLDDKNIEVGSGLEETLKNIQTFFQEGAEHETLDGNGGYVKTKLPPRLLVVRTYVNSADTDGQLKNRSLDFGVDSSNETDKEVCDLVLKLGESGQTTDVVTRRTLICRALWQDIKGNAYRVIHPASSLLIEFSDVSNRRNPSLFLDMVVGLVCINHRQCDAEDGPNGEKIQYATYADYVEAARLFNSQGDYLGTRLDKAEFEAVQYIKDQGNNGSSLTGIFAHLAEKFPNDGWNTQKVRRLMDGRQDRELKGLSDSVPGIETHWEHQENGSKYKVYTIPGELALGVRVTVHDPRTKTISNEDLSHLSRRFPALGKEVNDSSGATTPPSYPKYPNTTKEGVNSTPSEREEVKAGNDNISEGGTSFGKTGKRGMRNEALGAGKPSFPGGKTVGNDGKTGIGPHPRKDEPTPARITKKPEDLAPVDSSEQIRVAAISEYGMAGWVDPVKLAHALQFPLEVVEAWLQANYVAYDRPGGGIGYTQRKAVEAGRAKA